MKILVEIEVPEGEFCAAIIPDEFGEKVFCRCQILNAGKCDVFAVKLNFKDNLSLKCQPCLDACRAAEGEK